MSNNDDLMKYIHTYASTPNIDACWIGRIMYDKDYLATLDDWYAYRIMTAASDAEGYLLRWDEENIFIEELQLFISEFPMWVMSNRPEWGFAKYFAMQGRNFRIQNKYPTQTTDND